MQKYYISFGQAHAHGIAGKTFDKDCVCMLEAESYEEAREFAFEVFGSKWCFVYTEEPEMEYFPRGIINLNNNKNEN